MRRMRPRLSTPSDARGRCEAAVLGRPAAAGPIGMSERTLRRRARRLEAEGEETGAIILLPARSSSRTGREKLAGDTAGGRPAVPAAVRSAGLHGPAGTPSPPDTARAASRHALPRSARSPAATTATAPTFR